MKKARAKRDGTAFTITFASVEWPGACPALGIPLNYERRRTQGHGVARDDSPSFDCLDPTQGYVRGNVAVISNRANTMKGRAMPHELRAVADWLDRKLRGHKE